MLIPQISPAVPIHLLFVFRNGTRRRAQSRNTFLSLSPITGDPSRTIRTAPARRQDSVTSPKWTICTGRLIPSLRKARPSKQTSVQLRSPHKSWQTARFSSPPCLPNRTISSLAPMCFFPSSDNLNRRFVPNFQTGWQGNCNLFPFRRPTRDPQAMAHRLRTAANEFRAKRDERSLRGRRSHSGGKTKCSI